MSDTGSGESLGFSKCYILL